MRDVWLLDTNILLRISKQDDPQYEMLRLALLELRKADARLCFTSQILGEFWNVCTRPLERNGFGLTISETVRVTRVIEETFEFLPDHRDVHERWRALLEQHEIKGVQVHDARLAAAMYVHGIAQLLTMNVGDFHRFEGLRAIHPADRTHQD
jgi:predicted nucleic acid-binding protein